MKRNVARQRGITRETVRNVLKLNKFPSKMQILQQFLLDDFEY